MKITSPLLHSDLETFQKCPLLLQTFRPQPKKLTELESAIRQAIVRIFFEELRLEGRPDYRPLITHWGKIVPKEEGNPISKHNDIIISLKEAYDQYDEKIFSEGWRTVAVNLDLYKTERVTYKATVPAVLTKDKKASVVFFTNRKEFYWKDNRFRMASAILQENSHVPVESYFVVRTLYGARPFITINKFNFKHGELARSASELSGILSLISQGYNVPNTLHCPNCHFAQKCKL